MSRSLTSNSGRRTAITAAPVLLTVLAALAVTGTGCDELSARRGVQKGDKLYGQAKYHDAVEQYEEALAKSDLEVGHHNAGLAYYKIFTGDPTAKEDERKEYAEKSASHFLKYLESSPNDRRVIDLLTQIWIDSDQYQKAIDYWTKVLAKDPKDPGVLTRLADVNRKAGKFEVAVDWLNKRVEAEVDEAGKAGAYRDIASVQFSRLTRTDLVDEERMGVADSALKALGEAIKLNPDNPQLYGLTAGVFLYRSQAHGATWARTVDAASQRYYNLAARKTAAASAPKPEDAKPEDGKDKPKPGEQK